MKGYKAFNQDLTCLDYQFTIGKIHTFNGTPVLCRQGFHFCTDLQDIMKYYLFHDMRVFEIEATGIITDVEEGCSQRACSEIRLVKELSLDEVILSITDSEYAYLWALNIGNIDIMVDRITESNDAYKWTRDIGNEDIMINHITESEDAYWWAREIGNRDIMINHVTESKIAYWWAMDIGNVDIMKSRVTEPYWIDIWNSRFPNDEII